MKDGGQSEAERAAEAARDEETAEAVVAALAAERRRGRIFSVPQENVIALGALALSLIVAIINVYYAMRGAEIVVRPPDQVLLYREGEGDYAVLGVAVPVMMINAASGEHGDVLTEAWVVPGADGPRYPYASLVQPIFTEDSEAAREKCEVGTRCLSFPSLVMVERSEEILDVPGGTARSRYVAFHLTPTECEGGPAACGRFGDFRKSLAALEGQPLHFTVTLEFHNDGRRTLTCRAPAVALSYLADDGWQAMNCQSAEVRGDRFL